MMKLVDLHTHTTASDGTDTPEELVRHAREADLAAVAVTDHDTVSGLDEAVRTGRELGVEVIRGCELSTASEKGEIHILGLWLPADIGPLGEKLAYLRRMRGERNARIVDRLHELGVDISMEEIRAEARGDAVGRPHIAAVLVRRGFCPDARAAFADYLGRTGRAYVPRTLLEPGETVRMLHDLGATVVWAHPMLTRADMAWREEFMAGLKEHGLDAVEAHHSDHSEADARECAAMAARHGLAVSGGSDYHGGNKPKIRLGVGHGRLRVPYSILEDLKALRAGRGLPTEIA